MDFAMTERPIELSPETARQALADLPRIARRAFGVVMALEIGNLTIVVPDGRRFLVKGRQPGPEAELVVHDWRFVRRVLSAGTVGVGESFIAGEWSSPDVTAFLEVFARNSDATEEALAARPLVRMLLHLRHLLNRNTRRGSKRNISAHYDLGNAFYSAWLDRSMTYSAALYETGANDLEAAQKEKYRALARATDIRPGHRVLEVGCGWGGFAELLAAEFGCHVTALTISREQHAFATKRIADAGLSDKVDVKLSDYRDEAGRYDRIVSVEMFEAVGERYWPAFFKMMAERLQPGGRAGIQVITIQDRMFPAYRRTPDFIQRHVFPGGMLPPPGALADLGRRVGLPISFERVFGLDYAQTLAEWRERFRSAWPAIEPLGFDERFKRLWEFYLHYCEAGFRAGNIDVRQIVFADPR
jgi:cyclopropane-fatty-acyl-phospholipid synthase